MSNKDRFAGLLAIALATGMSVRDAAKQVGCSEPQAYRLAKHPDVIATINKIRDTATQEALGKLTAATAKAVETLIALTGDDQESNIRLNASKAILTQLGPLSENVDFRKRLEVLEGGKAG